MRAAMLALLLGWAAQGRPPLQPVDPWVRYQGDVTAMGAAYFTLQNPGTAPVVVRGVTCANVRLTTIHESIERGGTMRMIARDSLVVSAGGRIVMRPGGVHLMLMGLARPLNVGERVTCTVRTSAGDIPVDAPIRAS